MERRPHEFGKSHRRAQQQPEKCSDVAIQDREWRPVALEDVEGERRIHAVEVVVQLRACEGVEDARRGGLDAVHGDATGTSRVSGA